MKKILLLLGILLMTSVQAQSENARYLYDMTLSGMSKAYEDVISDVKEMQRQIKKALPLIGKKNRIRRAACLQIESVVDTNITLITEVAQEVPTLDIRDEQVMELMKAIHGLVQNSEDAKKNCKDKDLDKSLAALIFAKGDIDNAHKIILEN